MNTRRSFAALLALGLVAAAFGIFFAAPSAQGRVARRPTIERAAEWGVWKARAGHVTSLDELAAEMPSFVHRGEAPAAGVHTPIQQPHHPVQARKPVLYLYASRSTHVRVRVGLPMGAGTLHYPGATRNGQMLMFSGQLSPLRSSRDGDPRLTRAPRGHFWNDLRQVPASLFTNEGSETERFIFYDGLTDLRTPFTFYGAGQHATVAARPGRHAEAGATDVIYAVHAGRYRRIVLATDATSPTPVASGDQRPLSTLERELRSQLTARGLTAPEAQSLLATWHHDLVEAPGDRRIYFIDRADYDQMLPLTVSPRPRQLVRVGLVIDLP